MTQLYMEGDELGLSVEVQPLFIDELENSKNSAALSADSARQSAENARTWLDNIITYKTNMELYYAQSMNNLSDWYNDAVLNLNSLKNELLQSLQTFFNNAISSINTLYNQKISSIETIGQGYVNQAQEYAIQAQNAVDNRVSIDCLIQAKALETGSVSDIPFILNDIKGYANSSFDSAKFSKTGTPIVTNGGIASGFGVNNYLTMSQDLSGNILKIQIPFKSDDITQEQGIISSNYVSAKITSTSFLSFTVSDGVNSKTITTSTTALLSNVDYLLELIYDKNTHTSTINIYGSDGTVFDTVSGVNTDNIVIPSGATTIKIGYGTNSLLGSVDLKGVGVNINGLPVFSGNKTGIDTIKPDDYTAVTTLYAYVYDTHTIYSNSSTAPTVLYNADGSAYTGSDFAISSNVVSYGANTCTYTSGSNISLTLDNTTCDASVKIAGDGIASAVQGSSLKTSTINIAGAKSWEFVLPTFTGLETLTSEQQLFSFGGINSSNPIGYIRSIFTTGGRLEIGLYYSSWSDIVIRRYIDNLTSSDKVQIKVAYENSTFHIYSKVNNNNWVHTYQSSAKVFSINNTASLLTGCKEGTQADLNAFKVYVDGDLVYQPLLKIPYTESKTGSKIVDSIYRDRVTDMYEQYGYAPYYTLSDTDFTLPMGDLYGMIENLKKLIIERTTE